MSVSSTSIDGVFQSIDHQASVWCNQLVTRLSSALRSSISLAPDARGERLDAFRRVLMLGVDTLESVSYMSPLSPEDAEGLPPSPSLALKASSAAPIPTDVQVSPVSQRGQATWRVPRIESGMVYVWQIPSLPTGDGVGLNLVVMSSLAPTSGWRLVVCSRLPEGKASDEQVVKQCVPAPDQKALPGWGESFDAAGRAVEVDAQDCEARANADCVPTSKRHRITRTVLALPSAELGTGRFLVFVAPPSEGGAAASKDMGWMVASPAGML